MSAGQAFVHMDRYLDTTRIGPQFLRIPEVAQLVTEAIQSETGFESGPFAVMPNHVHALIRPVAPANKVLQWLKGSTARSINQVLARTGEPLWQRESYDHRVRNAAEFARIRRYIEMNPVKAGLVAKPEQYRWSSASAGERQPQDSDGGVPVSAA